MKIMGSHEIVPIVGENKSLFLALNTSAINANNNNSKGGRMGIYGVETGEQVFDYFFENSQDITVNTCPLGLRILLMQHQQVDESGLSYYGNNTLLLFTLEKFKRRNIATVIGPIHALTWSPDGKQFVCTSGIMPARTIFYNDKGDPDFQLGQNRRNTLEWSPNNKYLAVCGFGNLNGDVDIWDLSTKTKAGSCK